jgi:hypothetical protein
MNIWQNWGFRIIILWIAFAILTLGLVFYTLTIPGEIVEKNYYDKEISYQKQIDKISRFKKLNNKPTLNIKNNIFQIKFPENYIFSDISGTITFFRPSDYKKDFFVYLKLDSNKTINVNLQNKTKGYWKAKVDWQYKDSSYYFEDNFMN